MPTVDDLAQLTRDISQLTTDTATDAQALQVALDDAQQAHDALTAAGQQHQTDTAAIDTLRGQIAQLQAQLAAKQAGRTLVFSDDFPLSQPVNPARWNVRDHDSAGNNSAWYVPANVVPKADGLHLVVKHETGLPGQPATKPYTSGYIDTIGKFSQSTGRWEIVAKLPTARALWPAGWLRCDTTPGEIDILEAVGGLLDLDVETVHQDTAGTADKSGFEYRPAGLDLSQFHTFALERDADGTLRWYVDGVLTRTRKPTDLDNQKRLMTWLAGPTFGSPLNLRINLQVAGSMPTYYGLSVDPAQLPAEMVIRSVHVYA